MDIQEWFNKPGNYSEGLELYKKLPACNKMLLRNLERESKSNLLKLKYELKKALESGRCVTVPEIKETVIQVPKKASQQEVSEEFIERAAQKEFPKETMAMYPPELHDVYRARINAFYKACSLKIQLNRMPESDDQGAFKLQLEIEEQWDLIDNCWAILNHWKEHKRIMPAKESEDFSNMNAIKLVKKRDNLQVSISKRKKTIEALELEVQASPEDKTKLNLLNRKKEQLQQLIIDLEKVRNILSKEEG